MNLVHVGETQNDEGLCEAALLKQPLLFMTTFTEIAVGVDIRNYPEVRPHCYIED
jgi:hypothetical protein